MNVLVDNVDGPIEGPAIFDTTLFFERVKTIFYKTPNPDKNLNNVLK